MDCMVIDVLPFLENVVLFLVTLVSILQQRRVKRLALVLGSSNKDAAETVVSVKRKRSKRLADINVTGVKFQITEQAADREDFKKTLRFAVYVVLALLVGAAWIFGFVAIYVDGMSDLWYPFIVFNGLQVRSLAW
jgi:hypothetical protein